MLAEKRLRDRQTSMQAERQTDSVIATAVSNSSLQRITIYIRDVCLSVWNVLLVLAEEWLRDRQTVMQAERQIDSKCDCCGCIKLQPGKNHNLYLGCLSRCVKWFLSQTVMQAERQTDSVIATLCRTPASKESQFIIRLYVSVCGTAFECLQKKG